MNITEEILEIIADSLGVGADDLSEGTNFVKDLNADSIQLMEIVMIIEEEYNIEINEDYLEDMETIGDVIEYIENH